MILVVKQFLRQGNLYKILRNQSNCHLMPRISVLKKGVTEHPSYWQIFFQIPTGIWDLNIFSSFTETTIHTEEKRGLLNQDFQAVAWIFVVHLSHAEFGTPCFNAPSHWFFLRGISHKTQGRHFCVRYVMNFLDKAFLLDVIVTIE